MQVTTDEKLQHAARIGDFEAVKELISQKADPTAHDFLAIRGANFEIAEFLLNLPYISIDKYNELIYKLKHMDHRVLDLAIKFCDDSDNVEPTFIVSMLNDVAYTAEHFKQLEIYSKLL